MFKTTVLGVTEHVAPRNAIGVSASQAFAWSAVDMPGARALLPTIAGSRD